MNSSNNPSGAVLSFNTLTNFVIRDESGALDFDATMKKFAARVTEYDAAVSMETDKIAGAVDATFDKFNGAIMPMDTIVGFAITDLNPTSDNYSILKERVKDYIRSNADRSEVKNQDGTVITPADAPRTRIFAISKGKGGGVKRWSDHAEKPETK
jgi:hypothetical protein